MVAWLTPMNNMVTKFEKVVRYGKKRIHHVRKAL